MGLVLRIAGLLVAVRLALPAVAQDLSTGATVIQAVPGAPDAVVAGDPASAAAVPKTEEEKQIAELLKLKFDRSPASILQVQTTLTEGTAPAATPGEQFRLNVVAGRWQEAGAFLKTLPERSAAQLYNYLLKELERLPATSPTPQQQAGPAPTPTLLQNDVAELTDIAPMPLKDEQLKLLGALVTRVLSVNSFLDPLVARLDEGTVQLGGKEPAKRELAAQLLLNANRSADAAKFLPPLEPGRETASLALLEKHVMTTFSFGQQEQKNDAIQRAWELNLAILGAPECPAPLRERAWRRCGDIARFLPAEILSRAMKATFIQHPERGRNMFSAAAAQVAADRANRDPILRRKNLELQRQLSDALIPVVERRADWQPALNLFALNWMEEADWSKRLHMPPRSQQMQYDEFGNPIGSGSMAYNQAANPNQLPPIPIAELWPSAPDAAWLGALDASLLPRTLTALCELHLKVEEDGRALLYIEQLAALQPKEALRLANETLRVWATTHDPLRSLPGRRSVYYTSGGVTTYQSQGIPLTRALQQRNLEELSTLLGRLRKLPIPPLDDAATINAFTKAHSAAEVFREESIELVLGKMDALKPETLAELLQSMRLRLATQWRKPSVQQQAKTQRSDAQIDAEVLRGYDLLGGMVDKAMKRVPDDWRLHLAQAATWFDWAEFQYGKKVDLAIYVEKRERAFAAFQRAAELYAARVPFLEEKEETSAVYLQWLNANLGASDLALVTRQQEPSAKHLERIRKAILALPPPAAERHFAALAKAVASSESLPGHLRPGYFRAAFAVVGERRESVEIGKLVSYHTGLLREIELTLRLDGDATVGHGQPFGAFLTVRHTAELERENAGGFAKYLRNQSQNPNYYNPYGVAPIDYREELEKQVREKLSEGFEIVSLVFHDEKVQSRGYGRPGWRETPLLYLLLKTKDASVDRIPSLRLDADFIDAKGPVVLPIASAVQLIDARPAGVPPHPISDLEVTQMLDDRALRDGKLTVEIKATAKGVVPGFTELFDFAPTGFKVDEMDDSGTAVQRLSSEGDALAAATERTWQLKLSPKESTSQTALFQFPKPKRADLKMSYKRYQDADLLETTPELALAGLPLRARQLWPWALLIVAVLIAVILIVKQLRSKTAEAVAEVSYALPPTITPFTTLDLLRRINTDPRLAWSAEQRAELSQSIAGIETYYFAHRSNGEPGPDLASIGGRWVAQTRASAKQTW